MKNKKDLGRVDQKKKAILLDASQLLHMAVNNSQVKHVTTEYTFNDQLVIVDDISLKAAGPMEDYIFASDINIHHNIRRGLSVLTFQDGRKIICRRGLKKFFDLQYEELKPDHEAQKILNQILRNYTLKDVEDAFMREGGSTIQILKLEKANGENAQVSYVKDFDAWVMCSKNVTLLAKDIDDLEKQMFKDSRFKFALLIAQSWFEQIKQMKQEQVQQLKNILSNHTIIGEYCGNQNHQHLVFYDKIHIRFFAMVNHQAEDTCVDPKLAQEVFDKFDLQQVAIQKTESDNAVDFFKQLKQLFLDVGQKSLEEEGEGSVVYFYDGSRILSLGKLKTLEYRVFRKLREKLKGLLQSEPNQVETHQKEQMKKFIRECEELQGNAKANKSQDYYNEIAEDALICITDFIKNNHKDETKIKNMRELISSNYLDFINEFRKAKKQNYFVKSNYFDNQLQQIQLTMNSGTMNTHQNNTHQNNTHQNNTHQNNNNQQQQSTDKEYEEQKDQPLYKIKQTSTKKWIYVFYPITIPASGKTIFINELEESLTSLGSNEEEKKELDKDGSIKIITVSSDEQRKLVIDNYMKNYRNASHSHAFDKTGESYKNAYLKAVDKAINQANIAQGSTVMVFLDKNHPQNAITRPQQQFKNFFSNQPEVQVVSIGLVPYTKNPFQNYPFSLSYLLTCISRVVKRQDHQVLKGDEFYVAGIVLKFFTFFKRWNIDASFDQILKFPFTIDSDLSQEVVSFFEVFIPLCEKSEDIDLDYPDKLKQCIKYAEANDLGFPEKQKQLDAIMGLYKQ